jgi:phenylpyruvate tautomerase PptA (4-oxalocrotonate tautomerase family)
MLNKEETDVGVLAAQKAALVARITAMAQNRDANEPESVTDVYAEETENTLFGRY